MTPQEMISDLDDLLRIGGETVSLQRRIGTSNDYASVDCLAKLKPHVTNVSAGQPLAGNQKQMDYSFIMSPSGITADEANWPGSAAGGQWPRNGDFIVALGGRFRVEAAAVVGAGGQVVRIEGRVLG